MKSFLSGRPNASGALPSGAPQSTPPTGMRVLGHHHPAGSSEPKATVECVRQGDKVVRLVVTCSCGEKIEIDCAYAT